jgi:hypothetical protein
VLLVASFGERRAVSEVKLRGLLRILKIFREALEEGGRCRLLIMRGSHVQIGYWTI